MAVLCPTEISRFTVRSETDSVCGVKKKHQLMVESMLYSQALLRRRYRSQTGMNGLHMLARVPSSNTVSQPLQTSILIPQIDQMSITKCLVHPACWASMLVLPFCYVLNGEGNPLSLCIQI